jgi:hypothetical protein
MLMSKASKSDFESSPDLYADNDHLMWMEIYKDTKEDQTA